MNMWRHYLKNETFLQVYVSPLIKGYTMSLDYFENLTYIFATSTSMLLNAYTTLVLQKKSWGYNVIYIYLCMQLNYFLVGKRNNNPPKLGSSHFLEDWTTFSSRSHLLPERSHDTLIRSHFLTCGIGIDLLYNSISTWIICPSKNEQEECQSLTVLISLT